MLKQLLALFLITTFCQIGFGQSRLSGASSSPSKSTGTKTYEIGGIRMFGAERLDPDAIKLVSGLKVGKKIKIPGEDLAMAIKNIWDQGLFADVYITQEKVIGSTIFLNIHVKEQPRLSRFSFEGAKKSEVDELREEINLYKEKIVTENLLKTTRRIIKSYFIDKGFLNVDVALEKTPDSSYVNHVLLNIDIKKGKKVGIEVIEVYNNKALTKGAVRRSLKETKQRLVFKPLEDFDGMLLGAMKAWFDGVDSTKALKYMGDYFEDRVKMNIFKSSKFIRDNYTADKEMLIAKYNKKGYRDARILKDSIVKVDDKNIKLVLVMDEGPQYKFRDIKWTGNTKYSTEVLQKMLGIEEGDVYDASKLEGRLTMDPNGGDISSLYMDDGYLFFQIVPLEIRVEDDSIDIEIRIYEGQQATIDEVFIKGNSKTNDHVIRRELRTRPGDLFSRSDIIRSQQQLSGLGYFDPEQLQVNPIPDQTDGTVDIEYVVVEKPSDQIELSGGWGGGRVLGTLGVSFSNFSAKNFFKGEEWRPLPAGDGQRLSVRAQSNGRFFQSYNMGFTEPWLGGKKPYSFTISAYHSIQSNGQTTWLKDSTNISRNLKDAEGNRIANPLRQDIRITGVSVGLGQQLKWPDDYFVLQQEVAYQHYNVNQWPQFILSDGIANNLFYRITLSRNSQDQQIFPRLGSNMRVSFQATPPYSVFNNKDYSGLDLNERYRWLEYFKWKATSEWYTRIVENLVLRTKAGFGFINTYNDRVGEPPFERFYLGGSGLTGFALDGREIIALRGYDDQSVSQIIGGTIISKYTLELRYPFSLNPSATIYGLGFLEAGNTWNSFRNYNPFDVRRSAGLGVRVFLPMFGLLGLDYGWRFDDTPEFGGQTQNGQLHFTIGAVIGEL